MSTHASSFGLLILCLVTLFVGCDSTNTGGGSVPTASPLPSDPSSARPSSSEPKTSDDQESVVSKDTTQKKESFEDRLAKIESLLQSNQFDPAWSLAKDLIVERPQSPPAIFLVARIMAKRNNLSGAIQMISKIDPKDPDAGIAATGQLAEWLAQSGDLTEAEAKVKQVLMAYPSAIPALRLLVDIYHAQGRRWEAARPLERLIRLGNFTASDLMNSIDYRDPVENEVLRQAAKKFAGDSPYNKLADLRMITGANRWSDALEPLQALNASHSDLLEPWIWYGESLLEMDRNEGLQAWLQQRPIGFANHPEYWYIHGRMLIHQEQFPEAARCFAEALRLDRRHLPALQALSESLMELGQNELAVTVRNEAGRLVRIKDLAQQIQRGQGKRDEYIAIAELYRAMDDSIGAFAWDAILLVNEKQPISKELVEVQKSLRAGAKFDNPLLAKLPVADWPLPQEAVQAPLLAPAPPSSDLGPLSIRLRDVAKAVGIDAEYDNGAEPGRGWFTLEGIGGGVSILDFDRDGWPDFFYSQAGDSPIKTTPNYKPKQLYRSLASKQFVEVAARAALADLGYGQGTGVADIDQDGFADLLVADIGEIKCFRNQGDGTFERLLLPQAPSPAYWNSAIQAADLNGDSLPDVVQCAYIHGDDVFTRKCPTAQNSTLLFCHPKRFEPGKSRILFNGGNGSWDLAPATVLDSLVDGYALGSLITNIDGREGNDVFFANDVSPNHLLLSERSDGETTLVESGMSAGVAVDALGRSQASMGMACGDQNRDGLLDLIVTNFRYEDSTLYLQVSPGVFVDGTRTARLGEPTREWLSFGCQLSDLDNDGWLDFITVNGHIDFLTPRQMPPQVLKNNRGKFEWLRSPSPGEYFDVDNVGRSLAMTDYNRDGRLDFAITHLDRPTALLENESPKSGNRFLQLELVGTRSEREAIGAMLRVRSGKETWIVPVAVGDGFYGTNERLVHVGLGAIETIDSVEIEWPSGLKEEFTELSVDRRYRAIETIGIHEVILANTDPDIANNP